MDQTATDTVADTRLGTAAVERYVLLPNPQDDWYRSVASSPPLPKHRLQFSRHTMS